MKLPYDPSIISRLYVNNADQFVFLCIISFSLRDSPVVSSALLLGHPTIVSQDSSNNTFQKHSASSCGSLVRVLDPSLSRALRFAQGR